MDIFGIVSTERQWRFRGFQRGHGSGPHAFGIPKGTLHLRKIRKESTGRHSNSPCAFSLCIQGLSDSPQLFEAWENSSKISLVHRQIQGIFEKLKGA